MVIVFIPHFLHLMKAYLILVGIPLLFIFLTSCIYSRLPSYNIKLKNLTSIPDSSIKIINTGEILAESFLKSQWSGSKKTEHLIKKQKEITGPVNNFTTIYLNYFSIFPKKEISGRIKIYNTINETYISSIYYNNRGFFYDSNTNYDKKLKIKDGIALQSLSYQISLPDQLKNVLELENGDQKWMEFHNILLNITYGNLKYLRSVNLQKNYNFIEFYSTSIKDSNVKNNLKVRFEGLERKVFDLETDDQNNIVWSNDGLIALNELVASWLIEEQKYDILTKFLNENDFKWNNTLATKYLIIAANPPYGTIKNHEEDNFKIIKLLLSQGADPDVKNINNNEPAVITLTLRNCTMSVIALIKAGAKINVSSDDGQTLMDWAKQRKNNELVDFLVGLEKK